MWLRWPVEPPRQVSAEAATPLLHVGRSNSSSDMAQAIQQLRLCGHASDGRGADLSSPLQGFQPHARQVGPGHEYRWCVHLLVKGALIGTRRPDDPDELAAATRRNALAGPDLRRQMASTSRNLIGHPAPLYRSGNAWPGSAGVLLSISLPR